MAVAAVAVVGLVEEVDGAGSKLPASYESMSL